MYRREGEFKDGELWNGLIFDHKQGDLLIKVIDGKDKKKPFFGW